MSTETTPRRSSRAVGAGRVLVAVYAILALAATARSIVQIATRFEEAPVAYLLSALAGVVYIAATVALVAKGRTWYRVAWATIAFELLGVLVIGTLSIVDAQLFPADTVWSVYGRGYVFIPLVLPVLGLIWLARHRPSPEEA
ncbi:hypothetical protein CLV46_2241 [Diaminobutyricimonas aerilata]|uniref:Integral membrane protein n=1 Tax=Diaminobutyricimonas aerilata TaxID=1162967 RepID=A0A2M9CLB0_9MICO|nr:hypothetical protein [Diaminobutyricimonas aerilata]PJJ72667.1 hypothetical protein CLV46_2241 [Diaminobutyricimonas aerilata]